MFAMNVEFVLQCGFSVGYFMMLLESAVIEFEANAVDNSCRAWLFNSRGFASKVKNCSSQIQDCGANRECPRCHYLISNSDVSDFLSSVHVHLIEFFICSFAMNLKFV